MREAVNWWRCANWSLCRASRTSTTKLLATIVADLTAD